MLTSIVIISFRNQIRHSIGKNSENQRSKTAFVEKKSKTYDRQV